MYLPPSSAAGRRRLDENQPALFVAAEDKGGVASEYIAVNDVQVTDVAGASRDEIEFDGVNHADEII